LTRTLRASCSNASQTRLMTTIVSVRKGNKVVIAGDGQVTVGQSVVMKPNAIKVRRIGEAGKVITGFAGSTADALTLRERLESRIEEYPGQLMRACVELAKDWRTDKYLRKLDAMMIVSDHEVLLATLDVPTQACMDCCCACCLGTQKLRAEILISGHFYAHWKWRCFRAYGWCSGFYGRLASLVAAHHVLWCLQLLDPVGRTHWRLHVH